MRKALALTLGLVLVAGVAAASNTGFKLNYGLQFPGPPRSNVNLISFPYFYFPNGVVNTTVVQNAIDLCKDLNDFVNPPTKVSTVQQFLTASDTFKSQNCATTTKAAFNITPGEAYAIVPAATGVTINIVGSHDDDYKPPSNTKTYPLQFPGPPRSNLNMVSIPYHTTADNVVDLCTKLQAQTGGRISTIQQFLTASDTYKSQNCNTTTKSAFNITPGEAYAIVPTQANVNIAIEVY